VTVDAATTLALEVAAAGNINVGTDAVAKTVSIGDATGATAVNITSGTGNIEAVSAAAVTVDAATTLALEVAAAGTINVGTDAVEKTINIGDATGATAINIASGTGDVDITSADQIRINADAQVVINGAGGMSLDVTTGGITIGSNPGAGKTVRAGNSQNMMKIEAGLGLVLPLLTTVARDALVGMFAGTIIYNTTTNKLNFYNGAAWEVVTSV
jgi:prolyl-tRNA editing enzyme YbaK/EbsC (Cys-tRNA(Pro) deacylase)